MRTIAIILSTLLLLATTPAARAQGDGAPGATGTEWTTEQDGISVRVSASPERASIAGQIELRVTLTLPEGASVDWSSAEPELPEGWEISQRGRINSEGKEAPDEAYRFRIEPYLPGTHEIGAMTITIDRAGDVEPLTIETQPLSVEIVSVAGEDGRLADPRGVAAPERVIDWGALRRAAERYWWVALLVVLGVALGVYALRRLLRVDPYIDVPAHDVALKALDDLARENPLKRGAYKELYTRASDVVRTYIEDRFRVHAPEQTTEEFLAAAAVSSELRSEHVDLLARFLEQCDLVKFAGMQPGAAESSRVIETAREFVEQTKREDVMVRFTRAGERMEAAA